MRHATYAAPVAASAAAVVLLAVIATVVTEKETLAARSPEAAANPAVDKALVSRPLTLAPLHFEGATAADGASSRYVSRGLRDAAG